MNGKRLQQGIFREPEEMEQKLVSAMALNSLDVSGFDADFLKKSSHKRIMEMQSQSVDEYLALLGKDNKEGSLLLDALHVGYSEFFRNPLTFAVLERIISPAIFAQNQQLNRKEIRIWSAACAGGQEPYSVAILLEEVNKSRKEPLNYRIFATDKSAEHVDEARRGVFSQQELAKMTLMWAEQWFDKQGDVYVVKPELKRRIDFSVFDLLDKESSCPSASIFGGFDVVFCSNVLFYYKPEYQSLMLDKVTSCLSKDGYIIVSEVERDFMKRSRFSEVYPQSGIFRNIERV